MLLAAAIAPFLRYVMPSTTVGAFFARYIQAWSAILGICLVAWSASPSVIHLPYVFYEGVNNLRHSDVISTSNEGQHRWCWPSVFRASNTYLFTRGSSVTDRSRQSSGRCLKGAVYLCIVRMLNSCMRSTLVGSDIAKLATFVLRSIAGKK